MWSIAMLLSSALGAEGHYHPADVVAASTRFAEAQETSAQHFDASTERAGALAAALNRYEEALDLLGDRAPAADRERHPAIERAYTREMASLQAFVDVQVDDWYDSFGAALGRALASMEGVEECRSAPAGGGITDGGLRLPGRASLTQDCAGPDRNAELAAAIDSDAVLSAIVDEVGARAWPSLSVDISPSAPVGLGERYVDLGRFFHAAAAPSLADIDRRDSAARVDFAVAIDGGASKEELASMRDEAAAITAATADARASLARPLLSAAEGALARWEKKGEPPTAWCPNPELLGGCAGTDVTDELLPRLLEDRKVDRARP